jgi:hypothetical protein
VWNWIGTMYIYMLHRISTDSFAECALPNDGQVGFGFMQIENSVGLRLSINKCIDRLHGGIY